MTDQDEHSMIGRKYTERENAQQEFSRLAKKSLCLETILRETADALKKRREEGGNVMVPQKLPTHEQVMDLMDRQAQLGKVIADINTFFVSRTRC